jgi:hypothetical protein
MISSSIEPLKESPKEAERKELAQCLYLLPETPYLNLVSN